MRKKVIRTIIAFAILTCAATVAIADEKIPTRQEVGGIEGEIYGARKAERDGDTIGAAHGYMTAISYLESANKWDLQKLVLCDEPAPNIGKRMVYYYQKLYLDAVAKEKPDMDPSSILRELQSAYAKMEWIEPDSPTWPYLEAVSSAADGDYKTAFQKCREAAQKPDGEESVRQKARTLALHIKDGALQQQRMKEEDQSAYEEYVRSGAQALDQAMVSAQCSADAARKRGDQANADMWDHRYDELRKDREQIKVR